MERTPVYEVRYSKKTIVGIMYTCQFIGTLRTYDAILLLQFSFNRKKIIRLLHCQPTHASNKDTVLLAKILKQRNQVPRIC
jgi:putative component of membrane protein insertase Oxa1/YidC/SpoIIIJ protein YidD